MSGRFGSNRTALGIDNDVVGINANFLQHCSHQSCLVFAIAVMMGKDFRSSIGLPSAYSRFDGLYLRIVHPLYFVFPTGGKLKAVPCFADGAFLLETPDIL